MSFYNFDEGMDEVSALNGVIAGNEKYQIIFSYMNSDYDIYGTTLSQAFAICDYIHFDTEFSVPGSFEFSPSPFGANIEDYNYVSIIEGVEEGAFTDSDVFGYLVGVIEPLLGIARKYSY